MPKIIGADPGLAETGIGIVRGKGLKIEGYAFGTIKTMAEHCLPERLEQIYSQLMQVLKDENPDLMVVEDIFSLQKYPKSGIMLGKVTGVILLAGWQAKVPVTQVPVREAKQILTGNGNATKSQLEKAVRHVLQSDVPIKPSHASDALALALIGLFRYSR
jgi:crossover junction endodeoxyribonuclease RuvC